MHGKPRIKLNLQRVVPQVMLGLIDIEKGPQVVFWKNSVRKGKRVGSREGDLVPRRAIWTHEGFARFLGPLVWGNRVNKEIRK
jgi:hypothetical protein